MISRRKILGLGVTSAVGSLVGCAARVHRPTLSDVSIFSAGAGSAFLPYAQGVAQYLIRHGLPTRALESTGSIENVRKLRENTAALGTVFLGTAREAFTGSGPWTQGVRFSELRALTPMYETSFQMVALRKSGIGAVAQLSGRKVGVGPKGGPAALYFDALASMAGIQPEIIFGNPSALAKDVLSGALDALWQGAVVPIPAIKEVTDNADAIVFGISVAQQAAMIAQFEVLSASTLSKNQYRGQTESLASVGSWNFLCANAALAEGDAYWLTKTILDSRKPETEIHPSATATRAENARFNRAIPFHRGAARYFAERGIALFAPASA
jgi:uncharacterized protein